jgi:hypothetical protein
LHPALLRLLSLQARAALRRAWRGARTVKGALLGAVGLSLFFAWLLPTVLLATRAPPVDPGRVRQFAPLALLALVVSSALSAGDRALAFTPAEVNFLFAGPFTRRQLLAYKLAKSAAGSVLLALLLSLGMRRFSPFWPAAFFGGALALLLVNLTTTAAALVSRNVGVRLNTPARQGAGTVTLLAIAGAIAVGVARNDRFAQAASQVLHTPAARVLLAPLQPFGRAYAADGLADVLAWASLALLIDAALLALVMRLDANYLEAAAAAGEKAYEQRQRLRRGDWMPGVGLSATRYRVPALPWLGGAGPVAWRQATSLLRKVPRLLLVVVLCAVTVGPVLVAGRRLPHLQASLLPAVGWVTVMLVGSLRFDFRGDLDQLPWLKSLPLRAIPLAAGQLAVPTAALVVFHALVAAAVAAAIPPLRQPVVAAIVLAPPLDLLLVGVENLTFLLFPHRQAAPTELGMLGRQMLLLLLRLLIVAFACGIAGACAAAALAASGSPAFGVAVAVVVLGLQALALVPLVALAYNRFDPSSDTPP